MVYSTISIADLIQRITPDDAAYFPNGKVLVTKVEGLSLFVNPVKLSAVTALVCLSGEIDGRINLKKYHVPSRRHAPDSQRRQRAGVCRAAVV